MRLTQIKLAGFKSFVDPTTLQLASNLTSVVGPNGCGKSNVIDAVRWVTGESSARQLRGEALEDVIFNGSHARKPVGHASVELRFDNSEGKLGGQYGAFAEISVRRELTRDGASKFFINNARARRRDVVDLFLGTGLGGRSNYAVIEQGAVNRLVEAKPEDMRQVLEEAAGISRYKERRRETEHRIRHTRENLDRLNDLIGEITARLATLKRQAANAEKYKTLKAEERHKHAELLALRWAERSVAVDNAEQALRAVEAELREAISARRVAQTGRDEATSAQGEAVAAVQNEQARFYDAQAEVGRIEQALKHARELADMRARERQSLVDRLDALATRRHEDRQRDVELAETESTRRAEKDKAQTASDVAQAARDDAEQAADEAEQAWDTFNNQGASPVQQLEAEKTRAQYAKAEHDKLSRREATRRAEREALPDEDATRQADLDAEIARLSSERDAERKAASEEEQQRAQLQQAIDTVEAELAATRIEHGQRQAELAAERVMQQAVLREDDQSIRNWLEKQGHGAPIGVARRIRIDAAWQTAAEAALADVLHGFVVEGAAVVDDPPAWPEERITLVDDGAAVEPGTAIDSPMPSGLACLADGIDGPAAVRVAAAAIFVARDWAQAIAARGALAAHQRIVTLDGVVIGAGYLITPPRETTTQTVFEREQRIATLESEVAMLDTRLADTQASLVVRQAERAEVDTSARARQPRIAEGQRALEKAEAALEGQKLRDQQAATRRAELDAELVDLSRQLAETATQAEAAGQRVALLAEDAAVHTQARDTTRARLAETRRDRDAARRDAARAADTLGQIDNALGQCLTRRDSLRQRLQETDEAIAAATDQLERFDAESAPTDEAPRFDPADLERAQETRQSADRRLRAAREGQKQADAALADANRQLMQADQAVEKQRDALSQARVDVESVSTRRQGVVEQLTELGEAPAPIIERLAPEASVADWQSALESLGQRIARLGAINLAAIEEYDEAAERERYLAGQHDDLTEALNTLEGAIAKIDRETRQRFKTTYEQVNRRFSEMFPALFGGGEASLTLTEEDWLTTGVRVVARPPGKRNASIQMLSGGEKALAAVALLFALFELNPAPFCMLDEIDAPLDDANVARFCGLVRKMSAQVQFIVITHNKLTMELAEQLHGVTMAEPGVSRLVSVDIDAALDLAG